MQMYKLQRDLLNPTLSQVHSCVFISNSHRSFSEPAMCVLCSMSSHFAVSGSAVRTDAPCIIGALVLPKPPNTYAFPDDSLKLMDVVRPPGVLMGFGTPIVPYRPI